MSHTPDKWTYHIGEDYTEFYDGDESVMLVRYQMDEAVARRIVACLNECGRVGFTTEQLEQGGIARLVEVLERFVQVSGSCHGKKLGSCVKETGFQCVVCEGKAALAGLPKREGVAGG